MIERWADVRIHVHERPDRVREIAGGGPTENGCMIDILGEVAPGGTWEGFTYGELAPGAYRVERMVLIKE